MAEISALMSSTSTVSYVPPTSPFSGAGPITGEAAEQLVTELGSAPIVPHDHGYQPMEWGQFRNNCEDRAEMASVYLNAVHPEVLFGKLFVGGNIGTSEAVTWGYHVAVVVVVQDGDGPLVLRVLDLAMDRARTIAVTDWLERVARDQRDGAPAHLRAFLAGPGVWTYELGPTPDVSDDHLGPDDTAHFCADAAMAEEHLAQFAQHPPVYTRLIRATFVGVGPDGRVSFRGSRGATFGPFSADAEIVRVLEANGETPITVHVQRLYPRQDRWYSFFTTVDAWARNTEQSVLCIEDVDSPARCPTR